MRFHPILPVAYAMSTVIATYLYATSYGGTITTLSLSRSQSGFEISVVDFNNGSPETPVFLHLDERNGVLYCVEEGLTAPSGYLSSYRTLSNGSLTQIDRQATLIGPVHIAIYNSGRSMALAH
jgi:6-phosphogluconolactonase (cycloisomerase 2 family)